MANAKFGRVITAMITPFTADGEVDYEGAVTLAKHLVEHGSEGILVGGTTGEGATMTADEKLKLYAAVVNAVGRNASGKKVPVMGNLGGISTTESIAFAKKAVETGIDSGLVIVPFYVKPNQQGMYEHFAAIAKSVDLPIIIIMFPDAPVYPSFLKQSRELLMNARMLLVLKMQPATGIRLQRKRHCFRMIS